MSHPSTHHRRHVLGAAALALGAAALALAATPFGLT